MRYINLRLTYLLTLLYVTLYCGMFQFPMSVYFYFNRNHDYMNKTFCQIKSILSVYCDVIDIRCCTVDNSATTFVT